MLNETYILQYLEKKLGYKFNELEINPNEILETIKSESLPKFSKFFPYHSSIIISEKDKVPDTKNSYYLNTDLDIINVSKIINNDFIYSDINPLTRTEVLGDPFTRQSVVDMYSAIKNPLTFSFDYPNIITICPALVTITNCYVGLNVVHPDHFGTIPINLQDEFLELALYDVKDSLYQIRHRFSNLQTAYGNIELFIDDLQDANDKRKELFENWRRNFAKQAQRKKLYIY